MINRSKTACASYHTKKSKILDGKNCQFQSIVIEFNLHNRISSTLCWLKQWSSQHHHRAQADYRTWHITVLCPYPLSRFKSKRCPAVTLSISYLFKSATALTVNTNTSNVQGDVSNHLFTVPQLIAHFFYIIPKLFSLTLQ